MSPSARRRWCPATEQIAILTELYRSGLTNPDASQIQRIASRLSAYGDVQGKSVFYWFQNRKARDRQLIRRKIVHKLYQQHLTQQYLLQYQFQHTSSANSYHELFSTISPQKHFPQDNGASEESRAADRSMRMKVQDLMMDKDVGPNFPYCTKKPLETLELFPVRPPAEKDDQLT